MKQSIFRGIRRKLLDEGKLVRYITYAIGEVVLIIVGILFALNINDWNEEKKDRQTETKILTEIRINLLHDLDGIQVDISLMGTITESCDFVSRFLIEEEHTSEVFFSAVSPLRFGTYFNPNKSGYLLLVTKGVEIILNDPLRRAISNQYEYTYAFYSLKEEQRIQFVHDYVDPFFLEYFGWEGGSVFKVGGYSQSFEDYKKLKSDRAIPKLITGIKRENIVLMKPAHRIPFRMKSA